MVNMLHLNDAAGTFPPSLYASNVEFPPERPSLRGETRADVCIVGAGFTGIVAALELRARGYDVVVLEAHRVGWGASGRNGGQVSSGHHKSQTWLEKRVGRANAKQMWDLGEDAKKLVRSLSAEHAPDANFRSGIAGGCYKSGDIKELEAEADLLRKHYDYDDFHALNRADFSNLVRSPLYACGSIDRGAGHIHPLHQILGLGRAAETAGVRIFERSEVLDIAHGEPATVIAKEGQVVASYVVLAGNGYLPHIVPEVACRVMPINSFIGATQPIPNRQRDILSEDIAAFDGSHVVNYFRFEGGRFLFGGRANYSVKFPKDMAGTLHTRMVEMFPQLNDVTFDFVWGGTLGVTMTRLPALFRVRRNVLSASGYSGQGVALSHISGHVLAEAIAGDSEKFDVLSLLPGRPFPFGRHLQGSTMALAMAWYRLRDRLGV